jgi:hypothetical protein
MRKSIILILLIFFANNVFCITLKKILEIGDDKKEKYTFFSIGSITTDNNENIYVFDRKGYVLRKYDKTGNFLKETGKKGQGPGDFSFSSSLSFSGSKLYVFDRGNDRIAVYSKDLNLVSYIKSRNLPSMGSRGFFVHKNKIYTNSPRERKKGKISILNLKGELINNFFVKYPSFLKSMIGVKDNKKKIFLFLYTTPIFAFNKEKEKIAVLFPFPENRTRIFIYDKTGNLFKIYKTDILKQYKIPACMKRLSIQNCIGKDYYGIGTLAYLKNYLFLSYFKFKGGKKRGIPYFAIYDLKNRKILKNEKDLFYIIYHADKDKLYVSNADNDKVIVFEIK